VLGEAKFGDRAGKDRFQFSATGAALSFPLGRSWRHGHTYRLGFADDGSLRPPLRFLYWDPRYWGHGRIRSQGLPGLFAPDKQGPGEQEPGLRALPDPLNCPLKGIGAAIDAASGHHQGVPRRDGDYELTGKLRFHLRPDAIYEEQARFEISVEHKSDSEVSGAQF
jgi:hypothetical protein